jgi:hypothetical protein
MTRDIPGNPAILNWSAIAVAGKKFGTRPNPIPHIETAIKT